MLDFNKDGSIKILNSPNIKEISKIHHHTGFVATSLTKDSPIPTEAKNPLIRIIGAFILDSHVYIPRTDITMNTRENSFILPFGPIVSNNQMERITSSAATGTLNSLSYRIAQKIFLEYKSYGKNIKNKIDQFDYSQSQLFSLFSKEIDRQIVQNS